MLLSVIFIYSVLLAVAYGLSKLFEIEIFHVSYWAFTPESIGLSLVLACLLLSYFGLIFLRLPRHNRWFYRNSSHLAKMVFPIVQSMKQTDIIILSVLSGFVEEILFRGVLQQEFGVILTSVVFAGIHFGFLPKYAKLILLYLLPSFLLGCVFDYYENLLIVSVGHMLNNLVMLNIIKRRLTSSSSRAPLASSESDLSVQPPPDSNFSDGG